jgi:hypothetical protein
MPRKECKTRDSISALSHIGVGIQAKVGKRGGTVAANLSFMVGTVGGKMAHAGDNALAKRLDETGGTWFFTHHE